MEEKKYITVTNEDGTEREAEIVLTFHLDTTNKDYMTYTFNEVDDKNLTILYTAEVVWSEDGGCDLEKVTNPEEWNQIKELMRNIIKESSGE